MAVFLVNRLLTFIAALSLLFACAGSAHAESLEGTTVVLVRHAEKASLPRHDPDLSEAGVERANILAAMFEHATVSAIYTTQFTRNRQTAKPLADWQGIVPTVLPIESGKVTDYAQALKRDVLLNHSGELIVVVAHSNTVNDIILAFGGPDVGDLREDEYDRVFVVTIARSGKASLIESAFPSAPVEQRGSP